MKRKCLAIGIILLFVGTGAMLGISGYSREHPILKSIQIDKPDLFTFTWSLNRCGDNVYYPTESSGGSYRSWRLGPFCRLYEFNIGLQNDGDTMMNCTIETTLNTTHGWPIGLLVYAPGQYMSLTHLPEWIPSTISPVQIYGMQLFVFVFFTNNPVVVLLKATSSRSNIDWIFCDTSLSET
ncbi:Uncharacterised protein [uncultured archaeon]|nr:Uncharacterised protein [uncultured archaeon]